MRERVAFVQILGALNNKERGDFRMQNAANGAQFGGEEAPLRTPGK